MNKFSRTLIPAAVLLGALGAPTAGLAADAGDFRFGAATPTNKKHEIQVDLFNLSGASAKGVITARFGAKRLGTERFDFPAKQRLYLTETLSAKDFARLKSGRGPKLTVSMTLRTASGKHTVAKTIKPTFRGRANRYDGYYRGPGPIVLVVERGVITTVSRSLNAFCTESNSYYPVSFFVPEDDAGPLVVRPNGSFAIKGSASGMFHSITGKLTAAGKAKGYLSVYRSNMTYDEYGMEVDPCTGASNWTARRIRG